MTNIDYLPILGQLGRKAEAFEKWQKVLAEDPSWLGRELHEMVTSLWNIRDEDTAKLMEGIYKTGVLGPEAKPGLWPRATRACREMSLQLPSGNVLHPLRMNVRLWVMSRHRVTSASCPLFP